MAPAPPLRPLTMAAARSTSKRSARGAPIISSREVLSDTRIEEIALTESLAERERVLATLEDQIRELARLEAPFSRINAEIDRTRAQLDDIDSRLLSVQMSQTENIEPLRLIDRARPLFYPEEPKVLVQTAFGGLSGFLLAFMILFARDFTSATMRTQTDLGELQGVKALGPASLTAAPGGSADRTSEPEAFGAGQMAPYLGWSAFDTDDEVWVFDTTSADRARVISDLVLEHHPFSDNVYF